MVGLEDDTDNVLALASPFPWRIAPATVTLTGGVNVDVLEIVDRDGQLVALLAQRDRVGGREANARLLSLAPCLYEALHELIETSNARRNLARETRAIQHRQGIADWTPVAALSARLEESERRAMELLERLQESPRD